jgi:predicted ATPase
MQTIGVERLLERDGDLAALLGAVDAAHGGRGALGLVGGEAGIGKTSLLRALSTELGGDAVFLVGACEPLSVPAPLQPIRELAAAAGAPALAALAGDDRLALALGRALAARRRPRDAAGGAADGAAAPVARGRSDAR